MIVQNWKLYTYIKKKSILGVKTQAQNNFKYGELGRTSMETK